MVVSENSPVDLVSLTQEHEEALAVAASDGELWKIRYANVPRADETAKFIELALAPSARGPQVPFAVVDRETGKVVGSTRYYAIDDAIRRVYIGYTWYAQSMQRTYVNTACKLEMLRQAFDVCGANVVVWETDILNTRSQAAIERLGASRDGVLRYAQLRRDATVRDTVVYSMLAAQWPDAREYLRERLAAYAIEAAVSETASQDAVSIA